MAVSEDMGRCEVETFGILTRVGHFDLGGVCGAQEGDGEGAGVAFVLEQMFPGLMKSDGKGTEEVVLEILRLLRW